MHKFTVVAGLLASALAIPQVAFAAGDSFDWTGFYAGIQGGFASGDATAPYGFTQGGPYNSVQNPAAQSGVFGGVHIGAQQQMDSVVFGIEADIERSGVGGDDGGSGGDVNALNNDWQGSLRGRLGYAIDSVLVYGTAGLAMMNATATAPSATDSVNFTGFTVGGGVEAAFTDQISGRLEYRYTDFGHAEASFLPMHGYYEDYNPRQHSIRFGLSYHLK